MCGPMLVSWVVANADAFVQNRPRDLSLGPNSLPLQFTHFGFRGCCFVSGYVVMYVGVIRVLTRTS